MAVSLSLRSHIESIRPAVLAFHRSVHRVLGYCPDFPETPFIDGATGFFLGPARDGRTLFLMTHHVFKRLQDVTTFALYHRYRNSHSETTDHSGCYLWTSDLAHVRVLEDLDVVAVILPRTDDRVVPYPTSVLAHLGIPESRLDFARFGGEMLVIGYPDVANANLLYSQRVVAQGSR